MRDPRADGGAANEPGRRAADPLPYPTNHVVAVLDTPEQMRKAVATLSFDGFASSEIAVNCGRDTAHALGASTDRTGLPDVAIRVGERLHVRDDEMNVKERYEKALRDGKIVVSVSAPSDARKALAVEALWESGGHFINYLGRFSIESMQP